MAKQKLAVVAGNNYLTPVTAAFKYCRRRPEFGVAAVDFTAPVSQPRDINELTEAASAWALSAQELMPKGTLFVGIHHGYMPSTLSNRPKVYLAQVAVVIRDTGGAETAGYSSTVMVPESVVPGEGRRVAPHRDKLPDNVKYFSGGYVLYDTLVVEATRSALVAYINLQVQK